MERVNLSGKVCKNALPIALAAAGATVSWSRGCVAINISYVCAQVLRCPIQQPSANEYPVNKFHSINMISCFAGRAESIILKDEAWYNNFAQWDDARGCHESHRPLPDRKTQVPLWRMRGEQVEVPKIEDVRKFIDRSTRILRCPSLLIESRSGQICMSVRGQ